MVKFNEFRYELLPHPAYSPDPADLATISYFQTWRNGSEERDSPPEEQLIAETEAYFEGLDKSYYSHGLKKLENR